MQEFVQDVHEQCIKRDIKEMIENIREQRRQQRHQQQGKQPLEQQHGTLAPSQMYAPAAEQKTEGAEACMPSAGNTLPDREAGEDDSFMDID